MNTECYPNRAFCQIHNHGGISQANSSLPHNQITAIATPARVVKSTGISGDLITSYGRAKMAAAPLAAHPLSNRDWTQYSEAEHKQIRIEQKSNPMSTRKVSSKKFDYRPTQSALARGGTRRAERHFARQPRRGQGSKSQIPRSQIKAYRTLQFAKGGLIVGFGRILPVLGWGYYGYHLSESDDPYEMIWDDGLLFVTELTRARPVQQAAISYLTEPIRSTGKSMVTRYLEYWAQGLTS